MIKFFRKIRKKLISENRFTKYLLYAIGEIILVIIGILIALNINNKNEIDKNEKRFLFNLNQLKSELKANIENTTKGILEYERIDSILGSYRSDTLQISDFQTNDGYYLGNILIKGVSSSISNNSFLRLNSSNNILDESYNPLIFKLDSLYLIKAKELIDWNNRITSLSLENERELAKSQPWFSIYLTEDRIPDEGAKFFLEDPFYKNKIAEYFKLSRNHLNRIKEYRVLAIDAYQTINSLLELKNPAVLDSLDFIVDKKILKCYVGTYQMGKGTKTEVSLINENLHQSIFQLNGGDTVKSVLYPLSNNKFFILRDGTNFKFEKTRNCVTKYQIWKMFGGEYKFEKK